MAVMDEFREEREALKNGTFKEKLSYFWCYYKWHVIVPLIIIACLTSFIYEIVTRKDIALYSTFINCYVISEDEGASYTNEFAHSTGIDTETYEIMLDTSMMMNLDSPTDETTYNTVQKMSVYIAAGEIDTLACGSTVFEYYSYSDFLMDLREVYSEEQLAVLSPYLYYIDGKVLKDKTVANDNLEEYLLPYPDPMDPASMTDPIPVGVVLTDATEQFYDNFIFSEETSVMGIACTSTRPETSAAFIEYVLGNTTK